MPEPATGFTLYTNTILRTLPQVPRRRRVLVPLGADRDHARALREAGWVTVAALSPSADGHAEAHRLGCDYVIEDREPKPLAHPSKR
jgi:ATP phosphoribosyltransferase regulatory subunit